MQNCLSHENTAETHLLMRFSGLTGHYFAPVCLPVGETEAFTGLSLAVGNMRKGTWWHGQGQIMSLAPYLELVKILPQMTHPALSFLSLPQLCKMYFTYTVSPCLSQLSGSQQLLILSKYSITARVWFLYIYTHFAIVLVVCGCGCKSTSAPCFPIHSISHCSIDISTCGKIN